MGQALYRKYRSKSLSEIVGQEHVTATLANALKSGKISHAYLLSGPRGVGKTSIARILAHEINGLPYGSESHLDIIEIDAASNRRIDEIRDLRDRVNTAPTSAKYKVYIIDEVHMLTKEAFNALLKTLEEPPAHVVFILATTEAHKLPETIVSRTQRYSLRPVPYEQVSRHLAEIAKGENITIDDDALALIAEHGEGSFRDSISMLDQASSTSSHVAKADIERMLGLAPDTYITRLASALEQGGGAGVVATLTELYDLGYEAAMIAQQLGVLLRTNILSGAAPQPQASLELLRTLLDVPAARSPRQLLEIILLQNALPVETAAAQNPVAPEVIKPPKATKTPTPTEESKPAIPAPQPTDETQPTTPVAQPKPATKTQATYVDAGPLWQAALDEIKKQYNTLYGVARMANPEFDGSTLTLSFKFAFHQKRINEARNRKIFADIVEKLYGKPVQIICTIDETAAKSAQTTDVNAIKDIFGDAELLET